MDTVPRKVPLERAVLFLPGAAASDVDAAAAPHKTWVPVAGYGSKQDGWRAAVGYLKLPDVEIVPIAWMKSRPRSPIRIDPGNDAVA